MQEPRDRDLFARYLDGLATQAESAKLGRRLQTDPECARAFAAASRLDAALGAHFRQEKGQSDVRAIIQRIQGSRMRRRLALFAATAAAALLIVLTPALWLWRAAPPVEVLAGRVVAEGAEVTHIAYGVRFTVTGSGPTPLALGDGSGATLEPATTAAIYGPSGELRQAVELFSGGGDFRVLKDTGRFEVRTPVGLVTVLGTEFTVRLLPRKPSDGKGDAGMRAKGMLLAVAVLAGAVQVQVGERTLVLGVGQSQVFAGDEESAPRTSRVGGELTAVGDASITILQRGDSGERTKTFAVDAKTKVVIESDQTEEVRGEGGAPTYRVKLLDGTLGDLKVGRRVTVTCTEDGKAILIVLNRVAPRREGGEREGQPRVEKPRREGGDGEGEARPEKPRREGDGQNGDGEHREGEGTPKVEKPRREGGEGERTPKPAVTTGVLTGVKDGSIVVRVGGERGEGAQTFTVDSATKVGIEGERLEKTLGEGGDPIKRPAILAGTLANLKAGQRVSVMATPEGKALRIFIFRPQAPKREGEGGDRPRFRAPEGGGDRKAPVVKEGGGDRKPPVVKEGGGDGG